MRWNGVVSTGERGHVKSKLLLTGQPFRRQTGGMAVYLASREAVATALLLLLRAGARGAAPSDL